MSIYIFSLSFSALLGLLMVTVKKNKPFNFFSFSLSTLFFAVLFFLYIFRGQTVGNDYVTYNSYLNLSPEILTDFGIEKGYIFLNSISQQSGHSLIIFIVIYLITVFGFLIFSKSIKLYGVFFWTTFMLTYIYFMSFNMVRQMTAISIVFVGLSTLIHPNKYNVTAVSQVKRALLYLLCIYVATQFHASALVGILLPVTMNIYLSKKTVFLGFILMSAGFILQIGNRLIPLGLRLFPYYMQKYSGSLETLASGSKGITAYMPVAVQFVILFAIVSKDNEFVQNNKKITSLYLFYLFLFIGGGSLPLIRLQYYWMPAAIFFTAKYLQEGRARIYGLSPAVMKTMVILFWLLYSILRLLENNSGIVPYSFRM